MTASVLLALIGVSGRLAWAQDGTDAPAADLPQAEPAEDPSAEAPTAGLEGVLLAQTSLLLDEDAPLGQRLEAAKALGETADPRTFSALRVALLRGKPLELRQAAAAALVHFVDPRARSTLLLVAQAPGEAEALRISAVRGVAEIADPATWDVLYGLAEDRDTSSALRAAILEELRARNPSLLAQRGTPQATGLDLYAAPAIVANGVAGGVIFSAIGTLGQSDAGTVIGAVGGSLIGLGTGTTYALTRPLSFGQSLQWTSGIAGGVNAGVLIGEAGSLSDEGRAAARALGTLGGGGLAWWRMRQDPSPSDVAERAVAGFVGEVLAFNLTPIVIPDPGDYEDAQERQAQLALVGLGLGTLTGGLTYKAWDLEPEDAVFAGVVGAEAAVTGALLPYALLDEGQQGSTGVAWALGTGAALGLAELRPVSLQRSFYTAYGAAAGHALGGGLASFATADDFNGQVLAGATLAGGLGGAALGYGLGDRLQPNAGDFAILYIGLPLLAAEFGALNGALSNEFDTFNNPGLLFTGLGAGGVGLVALGHFIDPKASQVAVVGSAGAWGAWYGVLTPIALGIEGDPDGLIYAGIGTADAFMVGAVLAQTELVGLQPRSTLVPQLCGVGGATLGSLGAALFTSDGQAIAAGALGGSTLGFAAGVGAELLLGNRGEREALMLPRPAWLGNVPGHWSFSALPIPSDDGWGGQASLQVVGW